MNVRVSQSSLSRILRDAQRATAGKTPMEILRGIKLEAMECECLIATGTDLHVGIESSTQVAFHRHAGTVVVDADTLVAFVSSLDKLAIIDLVSDGKALTVTAGRSTASFALMPAEDFPDIQPAGETWFTMTAKQAKQWIESAGLFAR